MKRSIAVLLSLTFVSMLALATPVVVNLGSSIVSSPVNGDLTGVNDGTIVVGTTGGIMYALDYNGAILWQHPCKGGIRSSASVGDLTNDGQREIVFTSTDNKLHVLDHAGNSLWERYLKIPSTWSDCRFTSSPCLVDVDGDRSLEIVTASADTLLLLDASGSIRWFKRFGLGKHFVSSAAVGDIDNDGIKDIIVALYNNDALKPNIFCYRGLDGQLLWNCAFPVGNVKIFSSPVLADLNGDGFLEVIVAYNFLTTFSRVDIIDHQGTIQYSTWGSGDQDVQDMVSCSPRPLASPAITDLSPNDPGLDIVLGTYDVGGSIVLKIPKVGTILEKVWANRLGIANNLYRCMTAAIGDVDWDGITDVYQGCNNSIMYRFDQWGTSVEEICLTQPTYSSPLLLFSNSGWYRVVIGSDDGNLRISTIFPAGPVPEPPYRIISWQSFRHDPYNSGNYHHPIEGNDSTLPRDAICRSGSSATADILPSLRVTPNPARDHVCIALNRSTARTTSCLSIYNIQGQLIRRLNWVYTGGDVVANWDIKDQTGKKVKSGVYLVSCVVSNKIVNDRIIITR